MREAAVVPVVDYFIHDFNKAATVAVAICFDNVHVVQSTLHIVPGTGKLRDLAHSVVDCC